MKNNELLIGDTVYTMTKAYLDGAMAMRERIPFHCNPHADGTQANFDWDSGHCHEAAGLHQQDTLDVVSAARNGSRFVADAEGSQATTSHSH